MRKIKETEEGKKFEWVENESSGYWRLLEDEDDKFISQFRVPVGCPACGGVLSNWDNSFYNKWGTCSNCYYDHIESRENLPDFKNDNRARAAYVKEKIAEKCKS